jgi:hypothetical protein
MSSVVARLFCAGYAYRYASHIEAGENIMKKYRFLKDYGVNTLAPTMKNPNAGIRGTQIKSGKILSKQQMNKLRLEDRRFQDLETDDENPYSPKQIFAEFIKFLLVNGIIERA